MRSHRGSWTSLAFQVVPPILSEVAPLTIFLAKRIHNDAPYCSYRRVYSPRKLTSMWEGKIQLPAKKSTLASFPSLCFNKSNIGFLFTLSESQEWHFKGHVYPLAIFLLHHHVLSSHKIRPDNEAINPAGKIDVLFSCLPPVGMAQDLRTVNNKHFCENASR